jgi:lipoprotein-anchoring transpeptidase ErfK/SrfK
VSDIQRATIVILVIAALAVWGLGLRAALRPEARADQEPTAISAVTDTSARATPTRASLLVATPTASAESTSPSTTVVNTPSPAATASLSFVPAPSATPARQSTPVTSPTATMPQQPTPTLPPSLFGTPTIPQAGRFLLVNQDEQIMHIYEEGAEIRAIPVSSGRPVANAFTPAWRGDVGRYWGGGPFLDTEFWSDYMWYLFPGTRGSILIHSLPYIRSGDLKIYDRPEALGVEPTSHGCVRISPEDAQWLESWDPVGVPIEITPWSGEIGPPDESL